MASPTIYDRAKVKLVLEEPFFATILLNLDLVETKKLPDGRDLWLAATDGTSMYINPENFNQLSVAKGKGTLKHEVMHIAQLHPWRGEGKELQRWNQATDYAINPIILDEGGELPDGVLDGTAFKGQSAEQIYKTLPPMPPKKDGPGKGKAGDKSNPLGDDVLPAKDKSEAGVEKAKAMIAQAANVAKAQGKLPDHIKALVDKIMEGQVDWRAQLREWLTETSPCDYSYKRPNRRFMTGDEPLYLPTQYGYDSMDELGAMLDTSGSISMEELGQGLGEVVSAVTAVSPKRLVVAYCDSKVQHSDVFDEPSEAVVVESFMRHGGGGTSMPNGLKWFVRNRPNTKAVIVYTDGHTDWGDEEDYPFPVLWAITTPGIDAPWGTTIHINLNDDE